MDENKAKALSAALSQIEKQFGKGTIMRMGDTQAVRDLDVVSTGSLGLDIALVHHGGCNQKQVVLQLPGGVSPVAGHVFVGAEAVADVDEGIDFFLIGVQQ